MLCIHIENSRPLAWNLGWYTLVIMPRYFGFIVRSVYLDELFSESCATEPIIYRCYAAARACYCERSCYRPVIRKLIKLALEVLFT